MRSYSNVPQDQWFATFSRTQHLENQFWTAMEEFRKRMKALEHQSCGEDFSICQTLLDNQN